MTYWKWKKNQNIDFKRWSFDPFIVSLCVGYASLLDNIVIVMEEWTGRFLSACEQIRSENCEIDKVIVRPVVTNVVYRRPFYSKTNKKWQVWAAHSSSLSIKYSVLWRDVMLFCSIHSSMVVINSNTLESNWDRISFDECESF